MTFTQLEVFQVGSLSAVTDMEFRFTRLKSLDGFDAGTLDVAQLADFQYNECLTEVEVDAFLAQLGAPYSVNNNNGALAPCP